jgi:hypothetical protein
MRGSPYCCCSGGNAWWGPMVCTLPHSYQSTKYFLSGKNKCSLWQIKELWQGRNFDIYLFVDFQKKKKKKNPLFLIVIQVVKIKVCQAVIRISLKKKGCFVFLSIALGPLILCFCFGCSSNWHCIRGKRRKRVSNLMEQPRFKIQNI